MTRINILAILLFCTTISYAQSNEFIGVMRGGGPFRTGLIYKTDSVGNFKKVVHAFDIIDGKRPVGELFLAKDGSFYGTANGGGKFNKGVLFQYFPNTNEYKTLFHFGANSSFGSIPMAGVIMASNGKVYGSTISGGLNNYGTLFCYDPGRDSLTSFHAFENTNNSGYDPQARLTETKAGDLVIVTRSGGKYGSGAIYQIDTSTLITTKLVDFNNAQLGANPIGAMVEISPNLFYGVTSRGGSKDKGVLYEFNLATKTLKNKLNFIDKLTGEFPSAGLMMASNNKLYGTTDATSSSLSDVIYEYNPADSSFKKVYTFSTKKGNNPRSILLEGPNGLLIGTTSYSGNTRDDGNLYSYKIGEDTITVLGEFVDVKYGQMPSSGVSFGMDGKLYGLSKEGAGPTYDGVLYSFDLSTNRFERELFFNAGKNGNQPSGNLVQAANEYLYGVTQFGCEQNRGGVFSINPRTNELKTEASFTDSIGINMSQGFIEASNGKLYGVCENGTNLAGSLIEFDPNTKSLKKMADFEASVTGNGNCHGLMEAKNGDLYGVRSNGGAFNNGTLFKYNINNKTLTKLIDFNQSINGRFPQGRPVLVNGKLYGLAYIGGAKDEGVLYEFDLASNKFLVKLSFERNVYGKRPVGSMLLANNGLLYGTTTEGGDYSVGSLFEYNPNTNTLLIKGSFFNGKYAEQAIGELIQGSNGYIYGLTDEGGDNNYGILFEYKIGTKLLTRKFHIDYASNGYSPNGTLLELNQCKFTRTTITSPEISARAIMVKYQWLNCDKNYEAISGETNQNFRPKMDGNYAVEITSRFCKDTSDCVQLMPSGVNEISEKHFDIYPNPSTGLVHLYLKQSGIPAEIQVFNKLGMLVHEDILLNKNNDLTKRFETGVYYVVMRQGNEQMVKKIVVFD